MIEETQQEDQEEKEWWEEPDQEPEKPPSPEEMTKSVSNIKPPRQPIHLIYILRQTIALAYVLLNGFLLYLSIGKTYMPFAFLYIAPGFIMYIDYIVTQKRYKDLKGGR